jgi:hypothetical protein
MLSLGCYSKTNDRKIAGIPDIDQIADIKPENLDDQEGSINDFKNLYIYKDQNDELTQKLGVN